MLSSPLTDPPPLSGCSPQSDELSLQKKLRTEVIQLEDTLAQVRKEYEMLRIEFEQNLAANEQAGNPTPRPPPLRQCHFLRYAPRFVGEEEAVVDCVCEIGRASCRERVSSPV